MKIACFVQIPIARAVLSLFTVQNHGPASRSIAATASAYCFAYGLSVWLNVLSNSPQRD
jgi:hypothetical protein